MLESCLQIADMILGQLQPPTPEKAEVAPDESTPCAIVQMTNIADRVEKLQDRLQRIQGVIG